MGPPRFRLAVGIMVVAVLAGGALLMVGSSEESAVDGLRVGHANAAGWAIYEGDDAAGAHVGQLVEAADLDVLGVAEVCRSQLDRVATEAGGSQVVFQRTVPVDQPLPWSPPSDGACVLGIGLVLGEAVELLDATARELPTLDGPAGGPDAEEDRYVICARVVASDADGAHLLVCNTHLSHIQATPDTRLRQVAALLEIVQEVRAAGEPVVLVGDLNARLGTADLAPLADSGWVAASEGGADAVLHVFVTPGAWDVVDTVSRGFGRSDHHALWVVLRPAA